MNANDHLNRLQQTLSEKPDAPAYSEVVESRNWVMTRLEEHGRLTTEWHKAQTDKGTAELRLQRAKASIQQLVNEVKRLRSEQEFGHTEDCIVCVADAVLNDADELLLPAPATSKQRAENKARTPTLRSEVQKHLHDVLRVSEPAPAQGGKIWVNGRITVAYYDKSGVDTKGNFNVYGRWRFVLDVMSEDGKTVMYQRAMDVDMDRNNSFELNGVRVLVDVGVM